MKRDEKDKPTNEAPTGSDVVERDESEWGGWEKVQNILGHYSLIHQGFKSCQGRGGSPSSRFRVVFKPTSGGVKIIRAGLGASNVDQTHAIG